MPQDLVEGYEYPQMSDEAKRKILGENFLRLHGIDPDDLWSRIAGDRWAKEREGGLRRPWQSIREG
jgi:hypothetical protein